MKEIRGTIPSDWMDTMACAVEKVESGEALYIAIVYQDEDGLAYSLQGTTGARDLLCSVLESRRELDRVKNETHPGPFN